MDETLSSIKPHIEALGLALSSEVLTEEELVSSLLPQTQKLYLELQNIIQSLRENLEQVEFSRKESIQKEIAKYLGEEQNLKKTIHSIRQKLESAHQESINKELNLRKEHDNLVNQLQQQITKLRDELETSKQKQISDLLDKEQLCKKDIDLFKGTIFELRQKLENQNN